jgi:hypothetical protein
MGNNKNTKKKHTKKKHTKKKYTKKGRLRNGVDITGGIDITTGINLNNISTYYPKVSLKIHDQGKNSTTKLTFKDIKAFFHKYKKNIDHHSNKHLIEKIKSLNSIISLSNPKSNVKTRKIKYQKSK